MAASYEYLRVTIKTALATDDAVTHYLNERARDGWELVSVNDHSSHISGSDTSLYWRRPLRPDPPGQPA